MQGNQEVWCGPARGWSYHAGEWNSQWNICVVETECSESSAIAGTFQKFLIPFELFDEVHATQLKQWRIQDFPKRGGLNLFFGKIVAENCIKIKEIGPRPFGSVIVNCRSNFIRYFQVLGVEAQ